MRTPREKLKFVEASIAALLKQNKFKKDRLTWRRKVNSVTHIINIQLSQWNYENKIQFYVNVAIFDPGEAGYEEKKPKEWQCKKNYRIEHLKGTRESFHIDESTDEEKMAAQLVADIREYAFPWFEKETPKT